MKTGQSRRWSGFFRLPNSSNAKKPTPAGREWPTSGTSCADSVRAPALHALTLFNVAEHYRWGSGFRTPDVMYREPLSDAIPRERIYEIWSVSDAGPGSSVRRGTRQYGLRALKTGFRRTLRSQTAALRLVVWRLRRDFGDRLRATNPILELDLPRWMGRGCL